MHSKWSGNKESNPSDAVHGGGGVIALRSSNDIINHGVLSSNGSAGGRYGGGTICLCADGAVRNHGQIECAPNGRILIQCRQFVNDGLIEPEPDILIIPDGAKQREVDIAMMPWSGCKMEEIPLSVHLQRVQYHDRYRGHPRNLLDGKGAETQYVGAEPAEGDWIIFRIECPSKVIPKGIIIRNGAESEGLKSIELSLAAGGDEGESMYSLHIFANTTTCR